MRALTQEGAEDDTAGSVHVNLGSHSGGLDLIGSHSGGFDLIGSHSGRFHLM